MGDAIGNLVGGLFGAGYEEPEVPEYTAPPTPEEKKDPEVKSLRDEEQRKLRQRRYLSGTVLSQPLGSVSGSLLGKS